MTKFSCAMSVANWQAIEKAGGVVVYAGTLFLEYMAIEPIKVPFVLNLPPVEIQQYKAFN